MHVYCVQERLRAERYARHWHDLVAIMDSSYFDEAVSNGSIAADVARHKSAFFVEKDGSGNVID